MACVVVEKEDQQDSELLVDVDAYCHKRMLNESYNRPNEFLALRSICYP